MENNYRLGDFIKVSIDEFISGSEMPVDLFIQLNDTHFVQVAKAGERVQVDRLMSYKNKQVAHLLIKKQEFNKYLGRGVAIAGIIVKNKDIPLAQRQTTLTKIAGNVFAEIQSVGISKDLFNHARSVVSATVALCQSRSELFKMMEQFAAFSSSIYAHSVAVSMISVLIGTRMNWKQAAIIEKLGLGALLHDIGKREMSLELLNKPRADMNKQELDEFESHPFRGMQLLRTLPDMPDDVTAVAYEHHENSLGMGYPRRVKQMFMNPLARVVALADEFCKLSMSSPSQPTQRSLVSAINHIENVMGQPFWPDAFKVLKELVIETQTSKSKPAA